MEAVEIRDGSEGTSVVHLHLKVVPGGARSEIVGPYGERLRVRVASAPEGGRANRALLRLLAERLGVATSAVQLIRGTSGPLKTVEIRGLAATDVGRLLYGTPR